ncbi:hypothetical protein [Streptomyces griseus]
MEGEVTEPGYIDIILKNGTLAKPGQSVQHYIENPNAEGKHRKPYGMVQDALRTLRKVEREAKAAGHRQPCSCPPQSVSVAASTAIRRRSGERAAMP